MTKRPSTLPKREPRTELRLKMELVPRPLWGKNLRNKLGPKRWTSLRNAIAAQRKESGCAVCGSAAPLQGHEVWDYVETETTGIATLREIRLVCQDCSSTHHFGRFQSLPGLTPEEYNRVKSHALRVNNCDMATWDEHGRESFETYERRKGLSWTVDYGPFSDSA
jgi:hypothetical protein